jgi:hypothetical protein
MGPITFTAMQKKSSGEWLAAAYLSARDRIMNVRGTPGCM